MRLRATPLAQRALLAGMIHLVEASRDRWLAGCRNPQHGAALFGP